jgi:hypothetical protein
MLDPIFRPKRHGSRSMTLAFVALVVVPACQDDTTTVGDDRPHYVACGSETGSGGLTCGPGFGCCRADLTCESSTAGCSDPFQFASCDGPEDCDSGEQCWVEAHAVECAASSPYFDVRCHRDSDCVESARNRCLNGTCFGSAENVPPPSDAGP